MARACKLQALSERIGTKQARANAMTTEALVLLMGGQWANSLKLNLHMKLYAAATRRRLGRILTGERGAIMCERADDSLRDLGVKDLEAFTRIWVPGFA